MVSPPEIFLIYKKSSSYYTVERAYKIIIGLRQSFILYHLPRQAGINPLCFVTNTCCLGNYDSFIIISDKSEVVNSLSDILLQFPLHFNHFCKLTTVFHQAIAQIMHTNNLGSGMHSCIFRSPKGIGNFCMYIK